MRRVSSLAIPAYLASAASTLSLQADILSGCACTDDSYLQSYLSSWSSSFGPIPDTLPARQPFCPSIQTDSLLVERSLSSAFQRASFLAASSKHSGDWLYALPVTSCGMKLDDETVRVAIRLRLRLHGAVCSTSVPLWSPSRRIRTPCICLQKGRRQINSAPCSERAGSSCSLGGSNSQHEGTAGFMSFWRKKARWTYFCSVAER